jgi:hypothetical protein
LPCPSPVLNYLVARYRSDGTPDTTLGGNGDLDINPGVQAGATAVALDSQGRTVVSGVAAMNSQTFNPWQTPMFSAARISAPPVMLVSVSGRVVDSNGSGVSSVTVSTQGGISARTSPFGYYTLNNVPTNRTYTFSVRSKGDLVFNKRVVLVDDILAGLDFIGVQPDALTLKK